MTELQETETDSSWLKQVKGIERTHLSGAADTIGLVKGGSQNLPEKLKDCES